MLLRKPVIALVWTLGLLAGGSLLGGACALSDGGLYVNLFGDPWCIGCDWDEDACEAWCDGDDDCEDWCEDHSDD